MYLTTRWQELFQTPLHLGRWISQILLGTMVAKPRWRWCINEKDSEHCLWGSWITKEKMVKEEEETCVLSLRCPFFFENK